MFGPSMMRDMGGLHGWSSVDVFEEAFSIMYKMCLNILQFCPEAPSIMSCQIRFLHVCTNAVICKWYALLSEMCLYPRE